MKEVILNQTNFQHSQNSTYFSCVISSRSSFHLIKFVINKIKTSAILIFGVMEDNPFEISLKCLIDFNKHFVRLVVEHDYSYYRILS